EKRLSGEECLVQLLRLVADELAHREAAALAALHAVAHHRAAAREREQDVGLRDAMLLLIGFEKDVGEIAIPAELFELFERFDHRQFSTASVQTLLRRAIVSWKEDQIRHGRHRREQPCLS